MLATVSPHLIKKAMQNNEPLIMAPDRMEMFLALPYKKRGEIFEEFLRDKFFMSEYVSTFHVFYFNQDNKPIKTEYFSDVIYLPFEKIELPAPADYDSVLQLNYGDWRKPVIKQPHAQIFSTEISWREYFQKTAFK